MICNYCGTEMPNDAAFCPSCGRKVGMGATNNNVFSGVSDSDLYAMYGQREQFTEERQAMLIDELKRRGMIKPVNQPPAENAQSVPETNAPNSNYGAENRVVSVTRFCKACGKPMGKEQAVCLNCGVPAGKGKRFCYYCGNMLNEDAVVCVKCGCAASDNATNGAFGTDSDEYFRKLSDYERTSGIIWLVLGIIQVISLVGIICGVWNIIVAIQRLQYSKELLKKPSGVAKQFENQLTGLIIILIINIFFGAIIGIIGAIFDFYVRNYVLTNREKYN